MRLAIILLTLLGAANALGQEVIIEPVLGQIQIDNNGEYSCQIAGNQICGSCVEDQDDAGSIAPLIVAFGQSGLFGWSFGTISGEISLEVEIDGVAVVPSLLPTDSFFTSRIGVGASFTPIQPCPEQGLTYQIGSVTGGFTGGGNHEIVLSANEADVVPFMIEFCNVGGHWGAGCNVSGSINDRWLLHAPAGVAASVVQPGDPDPISFTLQGVVVDFAPTSGGTVTALRSDNEAPVPWVPAGPPGYWELHTDLPDGDYLASVTVSFDPGALPPGTDPTQLMLARYDASLQNWELLGSVVDLAAGTVTAQTDGLTLMVLTADGAVGTKPSSWGSLKASF